MRVGLTISPLIVLMAAMMSVAQCQINSKILCTYVRDSCMNQFKAEFPVVLQSRDIGRACQIAYTVRHCMASCMYVAFSLDEHKRRAVNVMLDYVCDESRRERMQQVVEAPCFTNIELRFSLARSFRQCIEQTVTPMVDSFLDDGATAMSHICGIQSEIRACFAQNLEDLCGSIVMGPYNDIINIIDENVPSDCEEHQAQGGIHDIAKRAVKYINFFSK